MQQQISFHDMGFLKTSQDCTAVTTGLTSRPSSKRSAPSATRERMCLDLRMGHGNLLGAYWETDTALLGGPTTLNTGEWPRDAVDCSLSQVLETNVQEKFFLSKTMCAGILRRAGERGKTLPDMLRDALMEVIGSDG